MTKSCAQPLKAMLPSASLVFCLIVSSAGSLIHPRVPITNFHGATVHPSGRPFSARTKRWVDVPTSVTKAPSPKVETGKKLETEEDGTYLAHKAKSTALIIRSPSIGSFTLAKGWSDTSLASFTAAVNAVVLANPVLTGRAIARNEGWEGTEIRILPGAFLPSNHSFVKCIDAADRVPSPHGLDDKGRISFIDTHVAPLVGGVEPVMEQIKDRRPLFDAKVVLLRDGYACVFIKMSHCIGDLVTYFTVVEQISMVENGEKVRPIDWDNPLKATHEIFPDEFSERDISRSYGLPFFLGILGNIPCMFLRKREYLLLDREKIKRKIDDLHVDGVEDRLSSNDIVTAALCDANESSDIFAFTRSMRGIKHGLRTRTAGNLHCEIPFAKKAGRDPHVIREILEKGKYYEPNEVPLIPFLAGRVGRITNCVTVTKKISFGGTESMCYCPPKSFLEFTPLDTAIIFRMNDRYLGVMHNFKQMDRSRLKDLMV